MNRDKLLHKALESIDWDFVQGCFKTLKLDWYEQKKAPTKKELVEDVCELVATAYEQLDVEGETESQVVTNHWIVMLEYEEETNNLLLEIIFTPIAIFIASDEQTEKIDYIHTDMKKLKTRLKLALQNENYELAAKIKKILDKQ